MRGRFRLLPVSLILGVTVGVASGCDDDTIAADALDASADASTDMPAVDSGSAGDGARDVTADQDPSCPPFVPVAPTVSTCARTFGDGLSRLLAGGVAADRAGNLFVTGAMYGAVDFGGGALTAAGDSDAFVVKLDASCNHVWSKRFGDSGFQSGTKVAVAADGDVVVALAAIGAVDLGGGALVGSSDGLADIVLGRFDYCGRLRWSKRFGANGAQGLRDLAIDDKGNVVLVGGFNGTLDFGGGPLSGGVEGTDIFVAKLDVAGAHAWSRSFSVAPGGGSHGNYASSVEIAADGTLYLAGFAQRDVGFASQTASLGSGGGLWILKMSADADVIDVKTFVNINADLVMSSDGIPLLNCTPRGESDLGTGPLVSMLPDGGLSGVGSCLGRFSPVDLAAEWVDGFGSFSPQRSLSGFIAATASTIGMSTSCVGQVTFDGGTLCEDKEHVFLRFGSNGALLSKMAMARGPVAVSAPGQFIIAGTRGDSPGSPERIIITKVAP